MNTKLDKILAEISAGELIDKITILEIKKNKISDENKLKEIDKELSSLNHTMNKSILEKSKILTFKDQLKEINQKLWDIEDKIRDKERSKNFDKEFIELARNVYFTNDERSRIKRNINETFGSKIIEEKSYADY